MKPKISAKKRKHFEAKDRKFWAHYVLLRPNSERNRFFMFRYFHTKNKKMNYF